jgi:hypothetical protein
VKSPLFLLFCTDCLPLLLAHALVGETTKLAGKFQRQKFVNPTTKALSRVRRGAARRRRAFKKSRKGVAVGSISTRKEVPLRQGKCVKCLHIDEGTSLIGNRAPSSTTPLTLDD